jgi:imidazolonepropionase-like amidohydrolase
MVRVEGERIAEVGRQLTVAPGARVLDLGDSTLLPGLIDLHTHLTGRPDIHWEEGLVKTTPPEDALWGAHFARMTLLAGFTTCRDMGPNWPYVDVALRNAIEQGAVIGPRLLVAGNYVSSTGGAGDARQFSIYVDVPLVRNLADGPDEITKAVRTNFKHGADFIKILATGAVLSKGIPPGAQQYSDEEIKAAVVEARRWGRQVAAHAHGAEGIKAAIRAGVRTIDHGSVLDDEAIGLLKGSTATFYVPTLYLSQVMEADPIVPPAEKERGRQLRERQLASFRKALAAGLSIGVATDVPVMPHGQNAKELAFRVSLGESPDERHRLRHPGQCRDPGLVGPRGHGGSREVGRSGGRPRRPPGEHRGPGARRLRHEGGGHVPPGAGRASLEFGRDRQSGAWARRRFGTPARDAASRPSTASRAPGPANRYRLPVTGPRAVRPVLPTYSKY